MKNVLTGVKHCGIVFHPEKTAFFADRKPPYTWPGKIDFEKFAGQLHICIDILRQIEGLIGVLRKTE
ncbi:MAG TPA: hypothetical protein GX390_05460 [Acholeplasmataceae bacterium]|nr:hypothetical protein [Acholeplasmataceae bacterium]